MTPKEYEGFLVYAAGICFLMAALNTYLVFKRGRSWAMVAACILAGVTLLLYKSGADRPALIVGGIGVFVSLVLDMVFRASQTKPGGPRA